MKFPWYTEKWLMERRRVDSDGCWIYMGSVNGDGYGVIGLGKNYVVHRVAWELWVDEIPEGHHVHHTCENPSCFNPDHLETKTPGDHQRFHRLGRKFPNGYNKGQK